MKHLFDLDYIKLTSEEDPDLKAPPLHAQHEHARQAETNELAPVLQTLQGPACKRHAESSKRMYICTCVCTKGC